ncbi:MAG: FAD binding domain-containing protein [Anaerolineae bacterium]
MWHSYYAPGSIVDALDLLARHNDARLIAGGTDLILEIERGVRTPQTLIDISRIPELSAVHRENGMFHLGANVTHNQVVATAELVAHAFPLARACWLVGAPQIRNRGTVAGNCVTASPANDTITPLWAMDATFTLASRDRGERTLTCDQFFLGVRKTALQPDEMLVRINVPALKPTERGTFLKLGLRQAQAISVVNVAVVVEFADKGQRTKDDCDTQYVARARIALGSVAPTIVRAAEAEAYLAGKELTDEVIAHAAGLAAAAARPISDIRGSAEYRRDMVRVLTARALRQLRDGTERADWPERPVLLQGAANQRISESANRGFSRDESPIPNPQSQISLTLNGKPTVLYNIGGKTLLRALREDAGLTGTKEGCAEGECGACTVWLDGVAVMSCLVPAERAEGCEVVTVEGLADLTPRPPSLHLPSRPLSLTGRGEVRPPLLSGEGPGERSGEKAGERLHPIQQAFIDAGAVQCGYCTPGLLMSAANLLEEIPQPTADQVKQALTGNLCRCTGYYKILEAIDKASRQISHRSQKI